MGFFDAVGNIVSGLIGYGSQNSQNKVNYKIAQENLGFQRENLDYQKALQKQIFEREDTAYQRTVNDMRLAGLNPVSMQGTNSAGEAIPTEPLHNDFQFQSAFGKILDSVQIVSNMRNNSSLTNAQSNLINAQAESQKIKNLFESDILNATLDKLNYENIGKRFQNERDNISWLNDVRNYAFNQQFGISDNMPDTVKLLNILTHQGKLDKDFYKQFERDWDNSFGRSFNNFNSNPDFSNLEDVFDKLNLSSSITESKFGNALLKLLGIGF